MPAKKIPIQEHLTLEDYEGVAHLTGAVRKLRQDAADLVPKIGDRTVWMVSSTARGGGVAEMMPRLISILRELGVPTEWLVISTHRTAFFDLTKRIHNLIHGVGDPALSADDRAIYDAVSQENAASMRALVKPDDLLVIHDPQPMGTGVRMTEELGCPLIWRCHIGVPEHNEQTRSAWRFLRNFAEPYTHALFSAQEYIPSFFVDRSTVVHPAIDPLGHKNRELHPQKLMGILCNASLAVTHSPVITPPFEHPAERLGPDGVWRPANEQDHLGLLCRPFVAQVSRWDKLKGLGPLLEAFVRLKHAGPAVRVPRNRKRLELCRLVLAGPNPASVDDDPEGVEVVQALIARYQALAPPMQRDIVLLSLPMQSRKNNALMVNVIQRCATVAVQNSLQEGFGLTVSEAMWKQIPVLGSRACGIRLQVRDGIDGCLIPDPHDASALARTLDAMLADAVGRERMGASARRRVHEHFLVFRQVGDWLRTLAGVSAR